MSLWSKIKNLVGVYSHSATRFSISSQNLEITRYTSVNRETNIVVKSNSKTVFDGNQAAYEMWLEKPKNKDLADQLKDPFFDFEKTSKFWQR